MGLIYIVIEVFYGEELAGIYFFWDVPLCICTDFNCVQFPSERIWATVSTAVMDTFLEQIFDLNLVDLPSVGGPSTWLNDRGWSRLKNFLIYSSQESHYLELSQKRLPCICSNHFSILLNSGGIQWVKRHFKFKNMWHATDGFMEKVNSRWNSYSLDETSSFIVASRLKDLKMT